MKTILVVDDDPSIAKSWKRMLHLAGYRVITASNGSEGFAAASVEMPALIITDRSMPIMDGVEFCRQLKRERGLARTPVILTSADTSATGAEGLWNEFLVKPVLMDVLLASVQRLLTSATDGREAED